MNTTQQRTEVDLLDEWMTRRSKSSRTVPERLCRRGTRFAFYGRTSTIGHQDTASSRAWQREAAESVIAGHGAVVAEFLMRLLAATAVVVAARCRGAVGGGAVR
jgi:hypothetical protein